MTRVLLTGAGGFLGAHLLTHLLATTDWDVVATDSFRHRGKTDRIAEVLAVDAWQSRRVSVLTHDLTVPFSEQAVATIVGNDGAGVDHIFHVASESHVDRSISDPVPFVTNNVAITLTVLELARRLRPTTVVQVSTDEVYGPAADGTAHAEWSTILPSNPYSASKAAQEAIGFSYWRTFGVPLVVVNAMNLIGERQDVEKFVPLLISGISRRVEVEIHGAPGAVGSRFYLHARNLADAIIFLARRGAPAVYTPDGAVDRPDRFNVVGEREIDNLALAELVATAVGRPLRYRFRDFHATRPGHDRRYALDGAKLAALGWAPPVPLEESLRRTVAWTLDHPAWLLTAPPVGAVAITPERAAPERAPAAPTALYEDRSDEIGEVTDPDPEPQRESDPEPQPEREPRRPEVADTEMPPPPEPPIATGPPPWMRPATPTPWQASLPSRPTTVTPETPAERAGRNGTGGRRRRPTR